MKGISFVLLFTSLYGVQAATDEAGSASTSVEFLLPRSIKKGSVYHRDAMFGTPFISQHEVVGNVEYIPGDACDENSYKGISGQGKTLPRIFLVNRAHCTFTQKARIAQSQGGSAVIVVNTKCDEENRDFWKNVDSSCEFEEHSLPYMADDGSGKDVTIPAFHIRRYDGQLLKNCLYEKEGKTGSDNKDYFRIPDREACSSKDEVMVRATIFIPPSSSNVKWNLWLSPENVPRDIEMLSLVATAIRKETSFEPKYIAYQARDLNCEGIDHPCGELCLYKKDSASGTCVFPSNNGKNSFLGEHILSETASQLCLFDQFKSPENQIYWWDYMREFARCWNEDSFTISECGKSALEKISGISDLDENLHKSCTKKEIEEQPRLQSMSHEMVEMGVFTSSVVINEVRADFGLNAMFVARELCDGFASKPEVCNCVPTDNDEKKLRVCLNAKCFEKDKAFNCPHTDICVSNLGECQSQSSGSGIGTFFLLLSVASIVGGAGFLYHKRERRQMQEQVRDWISEYVPLESFPSQNDGFAPIGTNDNSTVGVI